MRLPSIPNGIAVSMLVTHEEMGRESNITWLTAKWASYFTSIVYGVHKKCLMPEFAVMEIGATFTA